MKEYLHLFTPISDHTPVIKKSEIVLEESGFSGYFKTVAFWTGEYWQDEETNTMCIPTHVLDLSKLTTKAKASDAIEEAAKESYENCEWIAEREKVVQKWIEWL